MTQNPSSTQIQELLSILKTRFQKNQNRHPDLNWPDIESKIITNSKTLETLYKMESTGGEPDVVKFKEIITFTDCSSQSPKTRVSLCYDKEAWDSRKKFKPEGNAMDLATELGIQILSEDQYLHLQTLEDFDTKTSSWLLTPKDVRSKGGAIFGDKRYGRTFICHNGAESYYKDRGFRGWIGV